ncbi:radical SAM protein, partial [candidate division CSSED10-310 bacterium]
MKVKNAPIDYYLDRYQRSTDQEFIRTLYQNVLRRPVDEVGLSHYTAELQQGKITRRNLVMTILNSTEARSVLEPRISNLFIELTNICNFHCQFCASDQQQRQKGFMDFNLFCKLIDEITAKAIVTWTTLHLMGEPTLHPRFMDILQYVQKKNFQIGLNTNCSTFTPENVGPILELLSGYIALSLQTPTAESYRYRKSKQLSWADYIAKVHLVLRTFLTRRQQGYPRNNRLYLFILDTSQIISNVEVISTPEAALA